MGKHVITKTSSLHQHTNTILMSKTVSIFFLFPLISILSPLEQMLVNDQSLDETELVCLMMCRVFHKFFSLSLEKLFSVIGYVI